jgi:hypothetical protein
LLFNAGGEALFSLVSLKPTSTFPNGRFALNPKTGWVEKHQNGRITSMVQVFYRRIKPKKTPRKNKSGFSDLSKKGQDLYYILDKKINFGHLELTGDSVFAMGEILEVEFQVAHFNTRLRLLAKILKTITFMELKRVLFRGELKFAAVSKEDYERIMVLETERLQKAPAPHPGPKGAQDKKGTLKLTFKQS